MTDRRWSEELQNFSHVALVITISAFSLAIIALNRVMDWELWTIPIAIVGLALSIVLHVGRLASERARLAVYAAFLLLELFYYCVRAETVYDSTPVVAIMLILFAMTGIKGLIYADVAVGYLGMIFHLISRANDGGLIMDPIHIIRVVGHFALVLAAGFVTLRLLDMWGKLEGAYNTQLQEVMEENMRINTFLVNVSHEVRTPINAVVGLSSVLLRQAKDESIRKDLSSIQDAGHRVGEQIGDILDFTEIDMGKLTVSNEHYMIASLVNDVLAEYPSRTLGEFELVIDVDTAVPAELIGDSAKLKKILHHLIDNSIKFSQRGGVYVRIYTGKRPYGVNLCIEVADTGIGMTKDELEHIYDSFYQSDSGRARMAGGLGLGLTIVRGMVRAMKGFITIDSVRGEGTTVSISIPQKVAIAENCVTMDSSRGQLCIAGFFRFEKYDTPRVREFYSALISNTARGLGISVYLVKNTEELETLRQSYGLTHIFVGEEEFIGAADYLEPLASQVKVTVIAREPFRPLPGSAIRVLYKPVSGFAVISLLSAAPEMDGVWEETGQLYTPGLEVLVVDDEPMNLMVAEGLFGGYGMHVTKAHSGPESIELCKKRQFDIIFMDHMMPEMDGVEAMKAIRANAVKEDRKPIIVALTANAVSGAKEMFLSEGFDAFVAKPIETTEFERVLKRLLPRSALSFAPPGATAPPEGVTPDAQQVGKTVCEAPSREQNPLFERLKSVGVQTDKGMKFCRSDESFYRMLLGEFEKNTGLNCEKLEGYCQNRDWKNYAILIHALKSTAKMIGAEHLSETAATLEAAAKRSDAETVAQHHAKALSEARAILAALSEAMPRSKPDEDDVLEFEPGGDDVLEFAPQEEDILEFAPQEDEVLEFAPQEDVSGTNGGAE